MALRRLLPKCVTDIVRSRNIGGRVGMERVEGKVALVVVRVAGSAGRVL
jgi:hypothetical protein